MREFQEHYVTSDEDAQILGVTKLTVQNWARSDKIPAVMGSEMAGSTRTRRTTGYRFSHESLSKWRKERLTVSEATELLG